MLIDTHCHLYTPAFDPDRAQVVQRSLDAGVQHVILPGIDKENHPALMQTYQQYPDFCFPSIGLHPTSVDQNWQEELEFIEQQLGRIPFVALGEIGIDGYWSKEFLHQQQIALETQLEWAAKHNLPVIIHSRNAFDELYEVLHNKRSLGIRGVFHAYSGSYEQFVQLQKTGNFKIGIGGVLTYKNAGLAELVQRIDPSFLILETDAPWLTPVPHRGQRNESSFLSIIAQKLAELTHHSIEEIARITTSNAVELFQFSIPNS